MIRNIFKMVTSFEEGERGRVCRGPIRYNYLFPSLSMLVSHYLLCSQTSEIVHEKKFLRLQLWARVKKVKFDTDEHMGPESGL